MRETNEEWIGVKRPRCGKIVPGEISYLHWTAKAVMPEKWCCWTRSIRCSSFQGNNDTVWQGLDIDVIGSSMVCGLQGTMLIVWPVR